MLERVTDPLLVNQPQMLEGRRNWAWEGMAGMSYNPLLVSQSQE